MLGDVLYQLLLCIFRVKLGQEVKSYWFFLRHLLIQNLREITKEISIPIILLSRISV